MGNRVSRVAAGCFVPVAHDRDPVAVFFADPALDEGLGHSFCYVRPPLDSLHLSPSHSDRYASELHSSSFRSHRNSNETLAFRAISGASVSANTSTPHTILSHEQLHSFTNVPDDRHAAFESTASFASLPLQPVPRGVTFSGPISSTFSGPMSAPLERVFMSGPLERSYMSGPIDAVHMDHTHFSAPIAGSYPYRRGRKRRNLSRLFSIVGKPVKGAFAKTIASTLARTHKSLVVPVRQFVWRRVRNGAKEASALYDSNSELRYPSSDADPVENHNLQWAQGKAGEDRVHVVVSEDHGWLFVGIYDGFNGPDAPDFLMRNLYRAVYRELQGLLWDTKDCSEEGKSSDDHNEGGHCTSRSTDNGGLNQHTEIADSVSEEFKASSLPPAKPSGLTRSRTLKEFLENEDLDVDDPRNAAGIKQRSSSFSIPEFKRDSFSSLGTSQHETKSCKFSEDEQNIRSSQSENGTDERANESVSGAEEALGNEEGTIKNNSTGGPTNYSEMERAPVTWTGRSFSMPSLRHKQIKNKESHRKLLPQRYDSLSESKGPDKEVCMKEDECNLRSEGSADHAAVLKALSRALDETEEAYLNMADHALEDNPELALMGSCILVALIKDKDVYILNVGDSRAIVAQQVQDEGPLISTGNTDFVKRIGVRDAAVQQDLECISEESPMANDLSKLPTSVEPPASSTSLIALQLSRDHSTSIEEEVDRIKLEHPDDNMCILNDRVKGRLKVTRAFGAGFLKKPRWNSAILQMFQIDYVGSAPYVSCAPALHHHRLGPNDRFLILSSDGLYQYFSNQEVVSHVEWFMEKFPEGDPAQHLIEELLFRAAKKAGMDFHELLDIPQGDRRKYHDDVSVMVISLEGKVWRSSG